MTTRRTNKVWKKFDFDTMDNTSNSEIQEVHAPNNTDRINFNFELQIQPKSIDDLAVNIKKINDIEFWLQNNVISNKSIKKSSMLLITGPSGCGKTVTVRSVCKKLNVDVMEWINPIDKDRDCFIRQTTQLLEFLSESKYPSLFCIDKPKIILLEDYPNSVIHDPSEFTSVLEKCLDIKSVVIFICTDDNSNLNLAQTLFPQDVRDKFSIYNINFNAASTTLLKRALKRAQNLVQQHIDICKVPDDTTVDNIISSSMGDIRCAVNQFYFTCLKGSDDLSLETITKPGRKRKRKEKNITKIEAMMKNERLTFFHSIGRVLNPKREEKNGSWRLHCDVNTLVEELSIQPSTFSSFLHANYLKYFGDVNDICKAANILSLSQNYFSKWDNGGDLLKYGLWLSIMGVMIHNEHKVSKWTQITAPMKFRKIVNRDMDTKSLDLIDRCYYDVINNCNNSKTKFKI